MSADIDRPFEFSAATYHQAGWFPIPVTVKPGGTKAPSLKGNTGGSGVYADARLTRQWMRQNGGREVGLRLAMDMVGMDVDAYDGKAGTWSLGVLQAKWGKLPATWMSSSRIDGSGIRLFRLGPDMDQALLRDPKADDPRFGGIEVVRGGHRYCMAWPSRHPREGRPRYDWFDPERYVSECIPEPADCPLLPEGWFTGLSTGTASWGSGKTVPIRPGDLDPVDWARSRPGGLEHPCGPMAEHLVEAVADVEEAGRTGGCYPAACTWVYRLVGDAAEGHRGAWRAIRALGLAYIDAMRKNRRRPEHDVKHEFRKCFADAIRKLPADKLDDEDPCTWAGLWKPTLVAAA